MTTSRLVRRALLAVVLATITAPLVAFSAAMLSRDAMVVPSLSRFNRSRATSFGWTTYEATRIGLGSDPAESRINAVKTQLLEDIYEGPGTYADVMSAGPVVNLRVSTWGVPHRCFIGWRAGELSGTIYSDGDLMAAIKPNLDHDATRIIPFHPIYGGLILNAFWFWLVWLVLLSLVGFRRDYRRRRGLCAQCGYDLRGTPAGSLCPECGSGTVTI